MPRRVHSVAAMATVALTFPLAALADITNLSVTLSSGQFVSLDTGTIVTSGGDLKWDGTNLILIPQGSARAFVLQNQGSAAPSVYAEFGTTEIDADFMGCGGSQSSITGTVNTLFMFLTNGQHDAKVLVTAQSGTSITIEFTTYTSTLNTSCGSATGGPSITGISNNYSNIPPGAPNYGIAPGTLFVVYGTGLATTTNTAEAFPLQTSLSGTSIAVTVNGTTVNATLYYITPTQVAAVMPSNTPTGTATLKLTNGNQSTTVNITIVDSAFGALTFSEGTGQAASFHGTNQSSFVSYNSPAIPGEYVIFWGSGVGADPANNDSTLPQKQDNLTNIPMKAYVGGVEAQVYYRGRSQFPGVDQVIVILPQNVSFGCNVAVWFLSGASSRASNFSTIPVSATGEACSDANSIFGGVSISGLSGKTTVNLGFLEIFQTVSLPLANPMAVPQIRWRSLRPGAPRAVTTTTSNGAFGDFEQISGHQLGTYSSYQQASIGSCVVWQYTVTSATTAPPPPYTYVGLNAGTITITNGTDQETLTNPLPSDVGLYEEQLSDTYVSSNGGTFTFNGAGGTTALSTGNVTIGSFNTSISIGSPLFSSPALFAASTVTRSAGYNATWSGGVNGTYVEIEGDSTDLTNGIFGGFYCIAPQSDLAFQVPSAVTGAIPAGTGSLTLTNISKPVQIDATNLDLGFAFGAVLLQNSQIIWN